MKMPPQDRYDGALNHSSAALLGGRSRGYQQPRRLRHTVFNLFGARGIPAMNIRSASKDCCPHIQVDIGAREAPATQVAAEDEVKYIRVNRPRRRASLSTFYTRFLQKREVASSPSQQFLNSTHYWIPFVTTILFWELGLVVWTELLCDRVSCLLVV